MRNFLGVDLERQALENGSDHASCFVAIFLEPGGDLWSDPVEALPISAAIDQTGLVALKSSVG